MHEPRKIAWAFLAAAVLLVGFVVWLVARATAMRPGTGFEQKAYLDAACTGSPSASTVREPFAESGEKAPGRCYEWTAYVSARRRMRLHVAMSSQGDGEVKIDDGVVVADHGAHESRVSNGRMELPSGVHKIVATLRSDVGPSYFRLAGEDELEPHNVYDTQALDLEVFHPTAADALRALAAPPLASQTWRAVLAGCTLVAAGVLAWLALRARRGRHPPVIDIVVGAAVFTLALYVRAHSLSSQDVCWDEPTYVTAAQHYIQNLLVHDFHTEAWQAEYEHPPNTKWMLAIGWVLGGFDGARLIGGIASSLAAALLFAFGRVAFGRAVGAFAGALAIFFPVWVAHGRLAGHESLLLLCCNGSMLALACWTGSTSGLRGGDRIAAFMVTFPLTLAVFARPTAIWMAILLAAIWAVRSRRELRTGTISFPSGALVGVGAAVFVSIASWPWLWHRPFARLAELEQYWSTRPLEGSEFYLGRLCLPPWHYFVLSFIGQTPALLILLSVWGAARVVRDRAGRRAAGLVLMWLVVPFAECVVKQKIGFGRYVIQAYPALLLLAAAGLEGAGAWVAARFATERRRLLAFIASAAIVVAYTGFALVDVEPFPLDYWNEVLGGTRAVAEKQLFEVPCWGEGDGTAARYINANAPAGARVRLMLWPAHEVPRLRDDLVLVDDASADIVAVSHFQYFAKAPVGCVIEHSISADGAPLVDIYRCRPPAPPPSNKTELGLAAMRRPGGSDEALADFQEALKADPEDVGAQFGAAWALQAQGQLTRAEPLYISAADAADRAGNFEVEYYARFNLGTLYEQEGDHARAADSFRGAITAAGKDPGRLGQIATMARHNLGLALSAMGDAAGAAALERER